MTWVAERLHQGELPLWTPQVFGGYPIFADGEIGLAYPPVLLALLVLPTDRAFVVLRLLHLSIAALGTFALARTWRLPYSSAALAGVVFALGNFLQAQIHHENIVRTASWLPVMLAAGRARPAQRPPWRAQLRWTLLAALRARPGRAEPALADAGDRPADSGRRTAPSAGRSARCALVGAARALARPPDRRRAGCARRSPCSASGLAAVQLVPLIELAGFSRAAAASRTPSRRPIR